MKVLNSCKTKQDSWVQVLTRAKRPQKHPDLCAPLGWSGPMTFAPVLADLHKHPVHSHCAESCGFSLSLSYSQMDKVTIKIIKFYLNSS